MFSKLHPGLQVLTFVNSGTEANDLAMQMAKIHTKKNKMMCLQDAYHGTSELAMSVSPYKWIDKKNISNYKKNTIIAETVCTFRG